MRRFNEIANQHRSRPDQTTGHERSGLDRGSDPWVIQLILSEKFPDDREDTTIASLRRDK
jgi:hypothetical protein